LAIRSEGAALKNRLRLVAAAHGRSMEEKVRVILRNVLAPPVSLTGLGSRVHARFAALDGLALTLPGRAEQAGAASFEKADSTARRCLTPTWCQS